MLWLRRRIITRSCMRTTRCGCWTPASEPAALYVLNWSHFVRYDDQGSVLLDSRTVPALQNSPFVFWSEPLAPHSLQNVGAADLRVITVEVKR